MQLSSLMIAIVPGAVLALESTTASPADEITVAPRKCAAIKDTRTWTSDHKAFFQFTITIFDW